MSDTSVEYGPSDEPSVGEPTELHWTDLKLYRINHAQPVETSCCGGLADTTYWLATSREHAKEEIRTETDDAETPHGLCPNCMDSFVGPGIRLSKEQ